MIKKAGLMALAVYLLLTLLSPGLVHAHGGLAVVESSARPEFPLRLHFALSAESDVNITDIRLRYTVDRESFARVTSETYIEFVPATTVDIGWTLEMVRIGGLPPGSSLDYWWVLEDASGSRVETAPVRIQFDDKRYSWQNLTEGKVTIYWYDRGESFVQELMASAQQALARLAEDTGAYLERPVKIFVYASTRDLQEAMIFPQEWTGGVAFTRYGIVSIGIAWNALDWGKRAIVHELTHLVIHQMTFNPYGDLPSWLNEGLAMYAEGALEPGYAGLLDKAIAEEALISVRSLSSPFSAYAEQSLLAYAQSYSLVEFLIDNYGQGKMLELLNTFEQGSGYDGALENVYGFDMDGLDDMWRDSVTGAGQSVAREGVYTAQTGIFAVAAGLLVGLGLVVRYKGLGLKL